MLIAQKPWVCGYNETLIGEVKEVGRGVEYGGRVIGGRYRSICEGGSGATLEGYFEGVSLVDRESYLSVGMTECEYRKGLVERMRGIMERYEMLSGIFHVGALHAEGMGGFSLEFYPGSRAAVIHKSGEYYRNGGEHRVSLNIDIRNGQYFDRVLVHEMGHYAMQILYENNCLPYGEGEDGKREEYRGVIKSLEENMDRGGRYMRSRGYYRALEVLNQVRLGERYSVEDYESEYIVRYVEIVAGGYWGDREVRRLLAPLAGYWERYVRSDIEGYIRENAYRDGFVCEVEVLGEVGGEEGIVGFLGEKLEGLSLEEFFGVALMVLLMVLYSRI